MFCKHGGGGLNRMLQRAAARDRRGRHELYSPRKILFILLLVSLILTVDPRPASPQQPAQESGPAPRKASVQPLSPKEKLVFCLGATFGPLGLLGSGLSAGVNQWRDYPKEWEQGAEGYGRRFAASLGQRTAKNSIRFFAATTLHEDPRYFASDHRSFPRRIGHAIASVFVTRTDSGGRRFNVSELAGTVGSEFIGNQWYPPRVGTTNDALRGSAITLGLDAARNLAKEFWPDVKKLLRR
jgi:hypothetical protein